MEKKTILIFNNCTIQNAGINHINNTDIIKHYEDKIKLLEEKIKLLENIIELNLYIKK